MECCGGWCGDDEDKGVLGRDMVDGGVEGDGDGDGEEMILPSGFVVVNDDAKESAVWAIG